MGLQMPLLQIFSNQKPVMLLLLDSKRLKGVFEKNGWWYYRTTIAGKRRCFALHTRSEADAVSLALRIRESQPFNYKNSLEAAIHEFIQFKGNREVYSEQSQIGKKGILLNFAKIVGESIPVGTLSSKHIQSYFDEKSHCAESTKDGYHAALQSFISWGISEKHLQWEQCKKALKTYNFQTFARKEHLSMEEVETLLNSCDDDELGGSVKMFL